MRLWLAIVLLFFFAGPAVVQAAEGPAVSSERVSVRLVTAVSAVVPGEPLTVGLEQRIIPHWHTYWINPGDSGLPTEIDWTLPAGSEASAIRWPYPERYDLGPLSNYGYADQVTLLTDITPPADLKPGDSFTVNAAARWLVCEEICIPEDAELTLTLPVVAPGDPAAQANPASPGAASVERAEGRTPIQVPWEQAAAKRDGQLLLSLALPGGAQAEIAQATFFPETWGTLIHDGDQSFSRDGQLLKVSAEADPLLDPAAGPLTGVLVLTETLAPGETATRAIAISAPYGDLPAQSAAVPAAGAGQGGGAGGGGELAFLGADLAGISLLTAIAFAFLGGLTLNLMPCVFPVLSIKILSLAQQVGEHRKVMRLHGFVYTGGVLVSFAVLAGLLLSLRAGGEALGWGFQFQSPTFVFLMALLFFALGLMLSGVMTLGGSLIGLGGGLSQKPGMSGSFFTGVLATLAATPCTAPFMGAAVGFALAAAPIDALLVFLSLGLGLAFPYLLLTLIPGALSWLPKPGMWMERLKQVFAFPMYAAAIWLVWVLSNQTGSDGVLLALSAMLLLAVGAWIFEATRNSGALWRGMGAGLAAIVLIATVAATPRYLPALGSGPAVAAKSGTDGLIAYEPFSEARLASLRGEGRPVFVNFTADWCVTCLVNEEVAFTDSDVAAAFADADVAYLKGDWTNRDPAITAFLERFGRAGVPLYLYYSADAAAAPRILPQVLTPGAVIAAVTSGQKQQAAEAETSARGNAL